MVARFDFRAEPSPISASVARMEHYFQNFGQRSFRWCCTGRGNELEQYWQVDRHVKLACSRVGIDAGCHKLFQHVHLTVCRLSMQQGYGMSRESTG